MHRDGSEMARKRQSRKVRATATSDGDCVVPPALPKGELHKLLFRHSEHEAQKIKEYVEWQAHGAEKVLHVEKVASERVFGREYDVWDVHTDKERWWVVTSPTNLYSQTLMPSLDYVLSFHIGLMARVAAHREPEGSEAEQEFLLAPIERWFRQARHSIRLTRPKNSRLSVCDAGNVSLRWFGN